MAKEHGLMEHKGKTIPKEVKSLADRIRKEQPEKSDEYAYRTAWDIYRSHTAEGKGYPNKSPESGLKREGGGTGPLSKKAFWQGFEKRAGAIAAFGKAVAKGEGAVAKAAPTLDYSAMRAAEIAKKRTPSGTLSYQSGTPTYYGPGKTPAESALTAKAKLKEQAQKRIAHATKGGYTDPQIKRVM